MFTISKDNDILNVFYTIDDYSLGIGTSPLAYKYDYWAGWDDFLKQYLAANSWYPYTSKIRTLFWRGKISDCLMENKDKDCQEAPRYRVK